MSKKTQRSRWLDLLSFLEWEGINYWNAVNVKLQDNAIADIKEWLRSNLKHVEASKLRSKEAFVQYFYNGESGSKGSDMYKFRDEAMVALKTLFIYQKDVKK